MKRQACALESVVVRAPEEVDVEKIDKDAQAKNQVANAVIGISLNQVRSKGVVEVQIKQQLVALEFSGCELGGKQENLVPATWCV